MMKKLQIQYCLAQALFWITSCALMAFIAIFLEFKGLGNTEIGLAAGLGCLLTAVLSPWLSSMASAHPEISLQKFVMGCMAVSAGLYLSVSFLPMPTILIMGLFVISYAVNLAAMPLLSSVAMNYAEEGKNVSFGPARGIGSICYAISAILFTQAASMFSASILSVIYIIGTVFLGILLLRMPQTGASEKKDESSREKSGSMLSVFRKYPVFIVMLTGFGLLFSVQTALGTYLIRLIENLNGTPSLYGICIFAMAASELPFMSIAPKLIKKYGTEPLLLAAALLYLARNLLPACANSLPLLILGLMFQGCSFGLLTAVMTVHISKAMDREDQILGQSLFILFTNGVGAALGNLAGGVIQDTFGLDFLLNLSVSVTLIGVLLAVAASGSVLIPRLIRKARFHKRVSHAA